MPGRQATEVWFIVLSSLMVICGIIVGVMVLTSVIRNMMASGTKWIKRHKQHPQTRPSHTKRITGEQTRQPEENTHLPQQAFRGAEEVMQLSSGPPSIPVADAADVMKSDFLEHPRRIRPKRGERVIRSFEGYGWAGITTASHRDKVVQSFTIYVQNRLPIGEDDRSTQDEEDNQEQKQSESHQHALLALFGVHADSDEYIDAERDILPLVLGGGDESTSAAHVQERGEKTWKLGEFPTQAEAIVAENCLCRELGQLARGEECMDPRNDEFMLEVWKRVILQDKFWMHIRMVPISDFHYKLGDIIATWRGRYFHYGIYAGDEQVIHFWQPVEKGIMEEGIARSWATFICSKTSMKEFAGKHDVARGFATYRWQFSPEVTVARAHRLIGQTEYHLLENNCEHMVSWCATGFPVSIQVDGSSALLLHLSGVGEDVSQPEDMVHYFSFASPSTQRKRWEEEDDLHTLLYPT